MLYVFAVKNVVSQTADVSRDGVKCYFSSKMYLLPFMYTF